MPITFIAGVTASSLTGNGVTSSGIDTTGANFLVIGLSQNPAVVTVSDSNGNTYTALSVIENSSSNRATLYVCTTPISVGAGHTFTVSGGGSYPAIGVAAFSVVPAVNLQGESSNFYNDGTSPVASGSLTPSMPFSLVLTAIGCFGPAGTFNSGMTALVNAGVGGLAYGGGLGYLIKSDTVPVNIAYTYTSLATGSCIDTAVYVPLLRTGGGGSGMCCGMLLGV